MKMAVFYFGGYHASWDDVLAWAASAIMQEPNLDVTGYAWPAGVPSWPEESVVQGAEKLIKTAVGDIEQCRADLIYLVGHSSGCAIANAVEKRLQKVTQRALVGLVALDGYSPKGAQLQRWTTQVWGAMCDGQPSKNFPGPAGGARHIYQVPVKNCKQLWPLHFVLVNAAARDNKVTGTSNGYDNCVANLVWLPKLVGLARNAYQITFP
jgi:hypothetical protein